MSASARSRRLVLPLLVALCALAGGAHAQLPFGVAVRVNGVEISAQTVQDRTDQHMEETGVGVGSYRNPDRYKEVRRDVLDRLIDEELLWQRARDGGYEVAPARVEEDLDRIRAGFESEQMYRARLRIFGITEPELAAQITRRLSIRRLLDELVVASVTVSEEEIRVYYEAHREQFIDKEQVHARHILLKVPEGADQAAVEAVQARAEQLAAEARAGADFAELARLHSQGPSAPTGGDLGWFGRGRMVPGFELAAFRLQPGEISAPVSTEFGIHVIKVEDRRQDTALRFEEVAPALEQRLLVERREQALADFVAALRAAADIEVADVQ